MLDRIKIENTEVYGFKSAIRGMRNPMDSWHLSDSTIGEHGVTKHSDYMCELGLIGEKDLNLALRLTTAGTEHCEFLRQIRSEEHTSELQSRENLVCRLLLEKKKKKKKTTTKK